MALVSSISQNASPVILTEDAQTIAVEFPFHDASDVTVIADGVELARGSAYDVSGGDGNTGTVTFRASADGGPAVGASVDVLRYVAATQPTKLPDSHYYQLIERMSDRHTMLMQQVIREQQAIRAAMESGDWSNVHLGIPIIPDASVTRNKIVDGEVTSDKILSVAWSKITGAPEIGGIEVVGDGETDNTSVIQAAIDAANAAGGGVVPLPAGVFLVTGLTAKSGVLIKGSGKSATTLKLADASDEHVIQAGTFDTYANGVSRDSPVGCETFGLCDLSIDGNKDNQGVAHHGLAYYGVDMYISNVRIHSCLGTGLYCESPGAAHSSESRNLQHSIDHLECNDNDAGNIVYNGQSDSTLTDIICWTTGATASNVVIGSKSSGLRIIGLHAFGTSKKGLVLNATSVSCTNCAVESASETKVEINANSCQFQGDVYEVGSYFESSAFKIASGVVGTQIRARVSAIETAVTFASDGGNGLIDILQYSNESTAALFSGTPSASNEIRAHRYGGGTTRTVFQSPNQMLWDSDAAILKLLTNGHSLGVYTDAIGSLRQFNFEHTVGAVSYLSATGGTTKARLIARSANTDCDIELEPKGAGKLIVGNWQSNALCGAVMMFATSTVPTGWLECNGAAVSRATYAELFALVSTTYGTGDGSTTFNLPDLRGEFLRVWDNGKGTDSGRAIGTAQLDAFQGHYHQTKSTGHTSDNSSLTDLGQSASFAADGYVGAPVTDGTNGTPRVASETRPRNVALMACIKF